MARVELPLREPVAAADLADQLDQLCVARRDRVDALLAAVRVLGEDDIAAVGVHVHDALVIEERLEAAQAEDAFENHPGDRVLLVGGEHRLVGRDACRGRAPRADRRGCAGERRLVVGVERGRPLADALPACAVSSSATALRRRRTSSSCPVLVTGALRRPRRACSGPIGRVQIGALASGAR